MDTAVWGNVGTTRETVGTAEDTMDTAVRGGVGNTWETVGTG